MAEDIYFDASHKFREPRKFKKSSYKPKGKEYKYIDPAEGLIQQVETKIVKPKRAKRAKRDMVDVDKKMVELLEKRRKIRKAREVGQTVDPEELKRIEALKERAIVPSITLQKEREAKEKEEKAKADKAKAEADNATRLALEEGRHDDIIRGLRDLQPTMFLPDIYVPSSSSRMDTVENALSTINFAGNTPLAEAMNEWHRQKYGNDIDGMMFTPENVEGNDTAYRNRGRMAARLYNEFKADTRGTGRGLFGGKLLNLHPHLAGALISHDFIHRHANRILASLPAKHKGIKELVELKKNAKRAVVMSNKMYGKGFGDFFKKMVNAGKTLKDVYDKIPDSIKKPLEEKAKEAGRQQVQKASLYFQDKFKKKIN